MLSVHLTFPGTCEEAFRCYERVLGGSRLAVFHYGDTPAAADVPGDFRDKVVHATLIVGAYQLAGADVDPARFERPAGFYLLLSAATREDAERIFAQLADGGAVKMALQATFWSPAFGVLVDRFGTPWEITVAG
ncbi:MAG TPA: VOC family protein [Kofleriaceae bacterium]|nr:VOC family protein [Kofleriaceae bacterium]